MAVRVSPTEAIRAEIDQLFGSDGDLLSVLEQVARLSVRLTFQSVVEEVVCDELGRDRYERRRVESPDGYRNGWQPPRTLKTTLGPVELQRPKFRHAHSALCDQLFGVSVTKTNVLETLIISCWVRGLSDRDIEAMLAEVFGDDAKVSKATASRICQRLRAEFDAWKRRDLSKVKVDYLYLDGSFFKMHPKAKAEPVLAAWGIDTDGDHRVLAAPGERRRGRPRAGSVMIDWQRTSVISHVPGARHQQLRRSPSRHQLHRSPGRQPPSRPRHGPADSQASGHPPAGPPST